MGEALWHMIQHEKHKVTTYDHTQRSWYVGPASETELLAMLSRYGNAFRRHREAISRNCGCRLGDLRTSSLKQGKIGRIVWCSSSRKTIYPMFCRSVQSTRCISTWKILGNELV